MNPILITVCVILATQATPRDVEQRKLQKYDRPSTRAGHKLTPLDPGYGLPRPRPGQPAWHFPGGFAPTVAARARQFDVGCTDLWAAKIKWPHRLYGKVYDDLDDKDRQTLLEMQCQYIFDHGNPSIQGERHLTIDQAVRMLGGRVRHPPNYPAKPKPKPKRPR
jgi:hypothetical protein